MVSVIDRKSGDQLSEKSVSTFHTYYSDCLRYGKSVAVRLCMYVAVNSLGLQD